MPSNPPHLKLRHVISHFSDNTAINLVLYDSYPDGTELGEDPSIEGSWELTFETPDEIILEIDSNPSLNKPDQTNVTVTGPKIEIDPSDVSYSSLSIVANDLGLGLSIHNPGVIWARKDNPALETEDKTSQSIIEDLTDSSKLVSASFTSQVCVSNQNELDTVDDAIASIRSGMEAISLE